jgi:hypothetical protein
MVCCRICESLLVYDLGLGKPIQYYDIAIYKGTLQTKPCLVGNHICEPTIVPGIVKIQILSGFCHRISVHGFDERLSSPSTESILEQWKLWVHRLNWKAPTKMPRLM